MDIAIIILAIIFFIMIIIFMSLISYNMYKVSNLNNEQKIIIKTIENEKNKRFSNSIFMINAKNIFFKFANYLFNDIYKKICLHTVTNNLNTHFWFKECDEDSTDIPVHFDDKEIKNYNEKVNDMWKIVITTIKKIETPFYHKYTDSEIDNMIKETLSLNKFIENENLKQRINYQGSLIMNAGVKIVDISMDIISDMINHIIDDIDLQVSLFTKFKYIIEAIIIGFLSENVQDIKSIITSGTDEGAQDKLLTKFNEIYTKYNEINIEDQFSESVNRYYETPKYRNNKSDLDDKIENTKQVFEKINDDYQTTINE